MLSTIGTPMSGLPRRTASALFLSVLGWLVLRIGRVLEPDERAAERTAAIDDTDLARPVTGQPITERIGRERRRVRKRRQHSRAKNDTRRYPIRSHSVVAA
jgi:hypothetical protein